MLVRSCKVALVAVMALFYALAAFGNITDYTSNFTFVQHVMSMDTVFPDSTLTWRAMPQPIFHVIAFWLIIFAQVATALVLLVGAFGLWGERDNGAAFQQAKGPAVLGLTLGIMIYLLGFMIIAGEWFAMWQSETWNAQQGAFRFLVMTALVLLLLLQRDDGPSER
ncbi:MAG: DUF2165 family protein [Rhodospirillales bacterium]